MAERRLWARIRRHLLLLAGVLVVMVIVLHGCTTVYRGQQMRAALDEAEAHWGSFAAAAQDEALPPAGDNAAIPIFAAAMMHDLDMNRIPAVNRLKRGVSDVSAERQDLEAVIAANAEPLRLLDEALTRAQMDWRIDPPEGVHYMGEGPPYSFMLPLAGTNWVSGMVAIADGDIAGAMAATRRHFLLVAALENPHELVPQVLRIRTASRALDLVRSLLMALEPGEAALQELHGLLQGVTGSGSLQSGMVAEFKEMTRLYLLAVEGEGSPLRAGGGEPLDMKAVAVEMAGRPLRGQNPIQPEDVEAVGGGAMRLVLKPLLRGRVTGYIRHSDDLLKRQETPFHQRRDEPDSLTGDGGDDHWLARAFPDIRMDTQLLAMGDLLDARLELARTAIALRRWRQQSGSYPETLAALSPSLMPESPVGPLTGAPPAYHRQGSGFVLVSEMQEFEARVSRDQPWGPDGLLAWTLNR